MNAVLFHKKQAFRGRGILLLRKIVLLLRSPIYRHLQLEKKICFNSRYESYREAPQCGRSAKILLYPDSARIIDTAFSMSGTILQSKNMSLKWTNTNSSFLEDRFYNAKWQKPQDIDFESWYWLYGGRSNTNLSSTYSIDSVGLTFQISTGILGQLQYRPYLYDERANATTVHPFLIADYSYNTANWNTGTKLSWEPFIKSDTFSASKVSYSIQGKVAKIGLRRPRWQRSRCLSYL